MGICDRNWAHCDLEQLLIGNFLPCMHDRSRKFMHDYRDQSLLMAGGGNEEKRVGYKQHFE